MTNATNRPPASLARGALAGITVVFDLDGTLVDTAPDLINAANHVLEEAGYQAGPTATLLPTISHGGRAILRAGLAAQQADHDDATVEALFERFMVRYAAHIADASRPFPGLIDAMETLQAAGARFAVCTNKRAHLSQLLLDALGLSPRFAYLAGRDTFEHYKPHPDHLRWCVTHAGGDPKRAIMIGDSDTDIQTAVRAELPVVGVTFGYSDPPMRALKPTVMIDHYDQLEAAIASCAEALPAA
ncbi:MAG: HAD-IA family hydrolase [Pseudomonadota bacterium]